MLRFLFSFKGRINRAKFWIFYLISCIAAGFSGMVAFSDIQILKQVSTAAQQPPPLPWPFGEGWSPFDILLTAFWVLLFYVLLAMVVKRLHDRNKSAWWLAFFYGVPIASFVVLRMTGHLPQTGSQPDWLQIGNFVVCTAIIWWYLIEILFLPGTKGDNRFGPDPRGKKPAN